MTNYTVEDYFFESVGLFLGEIYGELKSACQQIYSERHALIFWLLVGAAIGMLWLFDNSDLAR